MMILILSPKPEEVAPPIERTGNQWAASATPEIPLKDYNWLVSWGYRHIIRDPALTAYRGRMINLHIS